MNCLDLILICAFLSTLRFADVNTENDFHIGLSISAERKLIEVSWRHAHVSIGDTILLLDEDPSKKLDGGGNLISLRRITPQQESGWVTTDVPYNYSIKYNISTARSQCYAFWVAYVAANNTVLKINCFRTHPTWMSNMKEKIGNYRISELFIPGTHDSASYATKEENRVTRYTVTQDENIMGQLIHGIRYLDIRVGYYNTRSPFGILDALKTARGEEHIFWANHGIAKMQPLQYIFEQIIDFVNDTNEIVIVDIQEFPVGFGGKDGLKIHRKLLHFIIKYLGEQMARPSLTWSATLNDIWKEGRRIIVSYDHEEVAQGMGSEVVFQAVKQQWGKARDIQTLYNHLLDSLRKRAYPSLQQYRPVSAMAELTPTWTDVLFDTLHGLRNMADSINRHVADWYFNSWGRQANIVALDFFRGTNIVEAALYWNEIRTKT